MTRMWRIGLLRNNPERPTPRRRYPEAHEAHNAHCHRYGHTQQEKDYEHDDADDGDGSRTHDFTAFVMY